LLFCYSEEDAYDKSLVSTSVQSELVSYQVFDISSFETKHKMHLYALFKISSVIVCEDFKDQTRQDYIGMHILVS